MQWIEAERYAELMQTRVEPELAARRETGFDERVEGEPIYYEHYRADKPKGVIVISHGFTESVRKFHESIYYMLQAGYEVWGVDHRGHGLSHRPGGKELVVHTPRFKDYVLDLVHLTETLVRPAAKGLPLYLYCHSMGGCVGAWTIEDYPELFRKAVLSSPMLGLSFGKIPTPVAYAVAALKSLGADKGAEPLSPVTEYPEETYEASASNSEPRFHYYYQKRRADSTLQTCAASAGWGREAIAATWHVRAARNAARIRIPVLLFQAENDTFVVNAAQDIFAARVKDCRLVKQPGMRHELYFAEGAQLKNYWETIFAFYES